MMIVISSIHMIDTLIILLYLLASLVVFIKVSILLLLLLVSNPHLGLINAPPLIPPPQNDLCHYSFTIKKARNKPNVGQILFTIHLLSKRPGRGAWDFINGWGLLIQGGDYSLRPQCPERVILRRVF